MILLIEDNTNHAELVIAALQDHCPQIPVEVVPTGDEGLARIERGGYDLALIDYRLLDGDGLLWLEKIVEREPDLPVIMVSGQGSERVAAEAFRKGVWDYVVKSIDYLDLLPRAVERGLEKARLMRERQRQAAEIAYLKQFNEDIVSTLPLYLIVLDRKLRAIFANRNDCIPWGGGCCEKGRHLGELFCSLERGERARVLKEARKVLRTQMPAELSEVRWTSEGKERVLRVQITPMSCGQEAALLLLVEEITSKKEMEQRRRLAALGEMVAGIAHEVKNPLQAIRLGLDLFQEKLGEEDGSMAYLLGGMRQKMRIVEAIVEDLLDYSRPVQLYRAPWDLRNVVEETLLRQEAVLTARGIRVVRDWYEESYETLIDGVRLGQVLDNLFANAIEAMDGGGDLRVSLGQQACQGQEWLSLEVADTGCGIHPQSLERVFDPFFTTKKGGMGLGLAIVHRLVELHRGHIEVCSLVGQGTTFRVLLPLENWRKRMTNESREVLAQAAQAIR